MVEIIDQFKQTWFVAQGDISLEYKYMYIDEKLFRYRIIFINSPYVHSHPTTALIRVKKNAWVMIIVV